VTQSDSGSTIVFGRTAGTGLLLIGIAALAAAAALFLRMYKLPERATAESTRSVEVAPSHNYELIQLGTFRRDQFLVDRSTGRVWHSVCMSQAQSPSPDCAGELFWAEMYVDGVTPNNTAAAAVFQQALHSQK
jgi:hypothetical protein